MRWKLNQKSSRPKTHDYRIRSGFLWFPMKLSNEWRWLEKATWSEKYIAYDQSESDIYDFWRKETWLDSQEAIDRIKNSN